MKVEWYTADGCILPCTEIVNHVRSTNFMTPKTSLFDGIFRAKRCGTVIPHRDFRECYV